MHAEHSACQVMQKGPPAHLQVPLRFANNFPCFCMQALRLSSWAQTASLGSSMLSRS